MQEEARKLVDVCKDFVRSMARMEAALPSAAALLSREEREEVLREVFTWLGSDEVKAPFTREVARELIGQLSASAMYADYHGSPGGYM